MKNPSTVLLQTISAFLLLMIPVYVIHLWTTAFAAGNNQEDRVASFKSSLPVAINNMSTLNLILLAFVIGGMVLAAFARKGSGMTYKLINTLLLAGGSLLLVLMLFWMM